MNPTVKAGLHEGVKAGVASMVVVGLVSAIDFIFHPK
jgi:hypothetical protein